MKVNLAWVVDPKDNKPSVSLTNLCISILFLVVAGILNLAGVIKETGIVVEYFGVSAALYFGRKISFAGKDFAPEEPTEPPKETP